jgi:hypothetical protein
MSHLQEIETYIDPRRGVLCRRAGHLVSEQTDTIPACARCGVALCPVCFQEGVRLASCPLGDVSCPNTKAS